MESTLPASEIPLRDLLNLESQEADRIIERLHEDNAKALEALGKALQSIVDLVILAQTQIEAGGRLIYVGAGTSGRLGVMDAAELPVTFGIADHKVQAIIAGGPEAFRRAIEGAEDSGENGKQTILDKKVGPKDLILGISASGNTPFVLGAMQQAKELGAKTALLCCNSKGEGLSLGDLTVVLETGPEVLAGSTRMKAATAQKMALTMLSTTLMLKLGYAFGPYMVGIRAHNKKLKERAVRIVSDIAGLAPEQSQGLLEGAEWDLKAVLVMLKRNVTLGRAKELLKESQGSLKGLLK
jgi:N-acetylmuramic acid 6-phosphate etherase